MHSTQKTCRLCGRTLPVEDFYPSGSNPRTGKIYRSSRCRKCHAMYVSGWEKKKVNRDRKRERERARYHRMKADPEWITKRRLASLKSHRRRGLRRVRLDGMVTRRSLTDALKHVVEGISGKNGATVEEAIARKALADTTWEVFQQYGVDVEGISALDRLSREDVTSIVSLYISNYVNERLQEELFYRVEKGSLDESTANQYADQIKGFIAEVVRLDFQNIDPLRIDWQGTEGQELIERKYQEAYGLLGEAE